MMKGDSHALCGLLTRGQPGTHASARRSARLRPQQFPLALNVRTCIAGARLPGGVGAARKNLPARACLEMGSLGRVALDLTSRDHGPLRPRGGLRACPPRICLSTSSQAGGPPGAA